MIGPTAPDDSGEELYRLIERLFPICRSITGEGLRETLRILREMIPLEVHEVPTGTRVFDWTVPREWNIRDAYVKNEAGERVIDFRRSNLHVVNYSEPIHTWMSLEELRPHLHTHSEHPDWIPYRTSYWEPTWGFCLSQRTLHSLPEGRYEVCIDSVLSDGSMSYGELFVEGEEDVEVLVSTHACHPSLCNDNLSGVAVAAFLARAVAQSSPRLSYRFLFLPGTIGSIAWLALNEERVGRIRHGLVLTCLGDAGPFTYKRTRWGDAEVDRAAEHVLRDSGRPHELRDFSPYGYDERQYGSPGFNLPVGCLMRTPWGEFPEYHSSADNLSFVHPSALAESLAVALGIVGVLDRGGRYRNLSPRCEPQLGRRGLWKPPGPGPGPGEANMALLWVLNLSDGDHSLLDIAERSGLPFREIEEAARALEAAGLLERMSFPDLPVRGPRSGRGGG